MNETISFNHEGERVRWTFEHNLDDFDLSLESAFENWSSRYTEFSAESFCNYVISKDEINLKCKCIKQVSE